MVVVEYVVILQKFQNNELMQIGGTTDRIIIYLQKCQIEGRNRFLMGAN